MSRKLLQILVGTAALFPVVLGLLGLLNGAESYLIKAMMNPSLDSNIRFRSAIFLTYGLAFFFILPKIEEQTALFRLLLAGLFVGGLARIFSIYKFGVPADFILFVLVLELMLPVIFVPWQRHLARKAKAGHNQPGN